MIRPDIELIEKQVKRGTAYSRMQHNVLELIQWIKQLEEDMGE